MRRAQVEDKALLLKTQGENYSIFALHQAASRFIRRDIVSYLKKIQKEFDEIETDEFQDGVEAAAVKLEKAWLEHLGDMPCFDFEIN